MNEEKILNSLNNYLSGKIIYDTELDYFIKQLLKLYNKTQKGYISKDKKEKITERLEQVKDKIQELTDEQGYWGSTELLNEEEFLLELLEEEN